MSKTPFDPDCRTASAAAAKRLHNKKLVYPDRLDDHLAFANGFHLGGKKQC
jgi:hypothetical protein